MTTDEFRMLMLRSTVEFAQRLAEPDSDRSIHDMFTPNDHKTFVGWCGLNRIGRKLTLTELDLLLATAVRTGYIDMLTCLDEVGQKVPNGVLLRLSRRSLDMLELAKLPLTALFCDPHDVGTPVAKWVMVMERPSEIGLAEDGRWVAGAVRQIDFEPYRLEALAIQERERGEAQGPAAEREDVA